MNESTRHIIEVVKELHDGIYDDVVNDIPHSEDEIDVLCRDAIKVVAKKYGIGESTIASQCTRELDIDMETFYDRVKGALLNPEDHRLGDGIKNKTRCNDKDDHDEIDRALRRALGRETGSAVPAAQAAKPVYQPPVVAAGDKVFSKAFGSGVVTAIDPGKKRLEVTFTNGAAKSFVYPDGFKNGHLRLEE